MVFVQSCFHFRNRKKFTCGKSSKQKNLDTILVLCFARNSWMKSAECTRALLCYSIHVLFTYASGLFFSLLSLSNVTLLTTLYGWFGNVGLLIMNNTNHLHIWITLECFFWSPLQFPHPLRYCFCFDVVTVHPYLITCYDGLQEAIYYFNLTDLKDLD